MGVQDDLRHGDRAAIFPGPLVGQMPNLKELKIMQFQDDTDNSKRLVHSIKNLEKLTIKHVGNQATFGYLLE